MAITQQTPCPSQQQPLVDTSGVATRPWYRWFTLFLGEALSGVVTDVTMTPPLTSTGTGTSTSGSSSGVVTIGLAPSGVTAGTYGDGSHVAQVTVTADGIVTNAVSVPISGGGGGPTGGGMMPVTIGGYCVSVADDQVAMSWQP